MEPITILPGSERRGDRVDEKVFRQMIRSMNLKVTDQRILILETLYRGNSHVTVQDLYEKVVEREPGLGFATVYRFLKNLTENGFVTEVRIGGFAARYELTPKSHHDHLTCIRCGIIREFENDTIEGLQERAAKELGFRLTGHVLELYGICGDCQHRESFDYLKNGNGNGTGMGMGNGVGGGSGNGNGLGPTRPIPV